MIKMTGLALALIAILTLTGCPKGSTIHRVTVIEHDFQATVIAFQDVEIAEYNSGVIDPGLHVKIETVIEKVAMAGKDLDGALAAGATSSTIKDKLDNIYNLLDSINTDGVSGIKNAGTKAKLEIALDSIKAIIDTALSQL